MEAKEIVMIWSENQKKGAILPCPRCGKWKMRTELCHNALSRRADVYVCSDCGNDEAIRDAIDNADGIEKWSVVQFFGEPQTECEYNEKRRAYMIKAVTSVEITEEDIDDIMVGALEGGINYWCDDAVVDGETYLGEFASEEISRGGKLILHDCEDDEEYTLDLEKFLNGVRLAIEGDYFAEYLWYCDGRIDCCQVDAAVADVIIQLALFGEVVYG